MSEHLDMADLAEAEEGLLAPEIGAAVAAHLAQCELCRHRQAELAAVSQELRTLPAPTLPEALARRLDTVIAAEVQRRAHRPLRRGEVRALSTEGRSTEGRSTEGRATAGMSTAGLATRLLAAAALVIAVGAAGYRLGTAQGWTEPPTSAATFSSRSLDSAAAALRGEGLAAHPFSAAWWCAREVVPGQITGLAGATIDDAPALLVYTHSGRGAVVHVVRGCDADPVLVGSADLPR